MGELVLYVVYSGKPGTVSYRESRSGAASDAKLKSSVYGSESSDSFKIFVVVVVLVASVLIASFFRSTISKALDLPGFMQTAFYLAPDRQGVASSSHLMGVAGHPMLPLFLFFVFNLISNFVIVLILKF